jgi:hypothetical protein
MKGSQLTRRVATCSKGGSQPAPGAGRDLLSSMDRATANLPDVPCQQEKQSFLWWMILSSQVWLVCNILYTDYSSGDQKPHVATLRRTSRGRMLISNACPYGKVVRIVWDQTFFIWIITVNQASWGRIASGFWSSAIDVGWIVGWKALWRQASLTLF